MDSPSVNRSSSPEFSYEPLYDPLTSPDDTRKNLTPIISESEDAEEEEEFIYNAETEDVENEESFSYPGHSEVSDLSVGEVFVPPDVHNEVTDAPPKGTPTPAQLEAVYAAASSGDLAQLRRLFRTAHEEQAVEPFNLANETTTRTGFTPLHAAASRGYIEIAQWLVQECGAVTDLEDKEGETALHKASLNGHLPIIIYLLSLETGKADVQSQDSDGYTALHNACSKGYLDIVRWLCEHGGASGPHVNGENGASVPGVDIKSKGGWTPLMNASSKGHLPVVRYLLSKQGANPLTRNDWGETAFDIAAAVFEIYICELLQKAEADLWRTYNSPVPYNTLAVHSTIPVILQEHQRLDTRIKTLAVNNGRPKFSAYHLGRPGRRGPFELALWGGESSTSSSGDTGSRTYVPAWRSNVQLPYLEDAFTLPIPNASAQPAARDGAERSHFWMSEWTLDVTHPRVDANDGWQYARTLEDNDDRWGAEIPPALERLLAGSGLVSAGLAGTSSGSSFGALPRTNGRSSSKARSTSSSNLSWARRRRWVRVMRRRLDVTPLPFLEPDGNFYDITENGALIPHVPDTSSDFGGHDSLGGVELFSTLASSSHQDYVARARYIVAGSSRDGNPTDASNLSATETKRAINKLSRAVSELRLGLLNDEDHERRIQAEVLINTYNRELERTRLTASANGLFYDDSGLNDDDEEQEDDYDSDDSFHYPTSPASAYTARPSSIRSHHTDYFSLTRSSSRSAADLTPQLAQAPEFRVPTHDSPQKVTNPNRNIPEPHAMHSQWERDDRVSECRSCKRRFTFYFRKHCRRCGRVYCNGCSSHRALLDPSDIVHDPAILEDSRGAPSLLRVCQTCFDEVNTDVPGPLRSTNNGSMEGVVVSQQSLTVPGHPNRGESSSQISDLADCPVCGQNLAELGPASAQEAHVRNCLEGGSGPGSQTAARYIVYKLPAESVLIGTECVICLEEFDKATLVARLSCLCTFHNHCLSAWLQRGHACPVHARDT